MLGGRFDSFVSAKLMTVLRDLWTLNQRVQGSSPCAPTKFTGKSKSYRGGRISIGAYRFYVRAMSATPLNSRRQELSFRVSNQTRGPDLLALGPIAHGSSCWARMPRRTI